MKKNSIYLFGVLFLCMLYLSSCKKKKDDDNQNTPPASMSAKINGQNWTASSSSATLIIYVGMGRRIDITGKNDGYTMTLSGEDESVSSVPPAATFKQLDEDLDGEDDFTEESNGLFTYGEKNNLGGYTYPFVYSRGTFTITSANSQNKTMSGTFSFRTDDYDYSDPDNNADATIVEITNGVFSNVPYTVYQ